MSQRQHRSDAGESDTKRQRASEQNGGNLLPLVQRLFDAFSRRGHELYVEGPNVRLLMGTQTVERLPRKLNLVSDAPPAEIHHVISEQFPRAVQSPSHPTKVLSFVLEHSDDSPLRASICEMREPRGIIESWLRSAAPLNRLERHLATREITVRAVALGPDGAVVDPFGGLGDLARRSIRTIAPPDLLLRAGPIWLLKIARYVSIFGFEVPAELVRVLQRYASNVLDLPADLWRDQMDKILLGSHPSRALQHMCETGVLRLMLPEVYAMVGFEKSSPTHHKDLWYHTRQVVEQAKPDLVIRWAALLHDAGKVWTRTVDGAGRVHFFRHEDMGRLLFDSVAHRFKISPERAEKVGYLIQQHSRVNLYENNWTESAVRRLIRETGEHLEHLLDFSTADITTRSDVRRSRIQRLLADLRERVREVRDKDSYVSPLPKQFGFAIMERFNLAPGPQVGRMRQRVEEAINRGELDRGLPVEEYLRFLEQVE